MTTTLSPKSLARTYDVQNRSDGWDAVEDYQRYLDVSAQNPDSGSSALSSKLEMPRGRIRSWDSKPDPARAVEVAEQRDWFGGRDTDEFAALNQLVLRWVDLRHGLPTVFCAGTGRRRRLRHRRAIRAGDRLATRAGRRA